MCHCATSDSGHLRRFERVRATSGLAPIAERVAAPHQVKRRANERRCGSSPFTRIPAASHSWLPDGVEHVPAGGNRLGR